MADEITQAMLAPNAERLTQTDDVPTSTVLPLDDDNSIATCRACGEPIPTGSMYLAFPEGFYHAPVCVNRRVL